MMNNIYCLLQRVSDCFNVLAAACVVLAGVAIVMAVALKTAMKFHPGVNRTPLHHVFILRETTPFYPMGLTEKL